MNSPHISFQPQTVFEILGIPITNSLLTSVIVLTLFLWIGLFYKNQTEKKARERSKFYYFLNFCIKSLYSLFTSVLGNKIDRYFPLLASFFIYIILQNYIGLIPGAGSIYLKEASHVVPILRGGTADLNTTIALALISVILTNIYSVRTLGFKKYISRFYRLADPMSFFVGTLEIISELSKVISFSFRLFGNIFAGEVLLTVIAFLIPILASFPFLVLEIFVGFIQALVFATLTAVFISVALQEHH